MPCNGDFRLSANGKALAPVFQAVSARAGGTTARRCRHPSAVGTQPHPLPGPLRPLGYHPVPSPAAPAAPATTPALATTHPATTAWKSSDLFSHQIPARPISPAGGPRR